jgi:hypothetical protein
MSDFEALRWILLPGPTSPKARAKSPAHKFTRASHFRGLTPPLRNFSGMNSQDARGLRRLSHQDSGKRLNRCVSGVDEP